MNRIKSCSVMERTALKPHGASAKRMEYLSKKEAAVTYASMRDAVASLMVSRTKTRLQASNGVHFSTSPLITTNRPLTHILDATTLRVIFMQTICCP